MSVYAKEYGYFFNSNNSDRTYNASSFEEWLKPFFLSGVFNGELQVTAQSTPDMTVNVAPGHANLDGKPAYWPDTNVITIDTASGVYNRIDTIVLRRDNVNRAVSIEYVKGTASLSPQPVAPTRNADTFELVLAQILVGVGVTEIIAADITDTRMNADICGWVAATVDQIDFDQVKTQFDSWMEVNQDEFIDWFQNLQNELDENQAANLFNRITNTQHMMGFDYITEHGYLHVGDFASYPTYNSFIYREDENTWAQTNVADAMALRAGEGIAILGSRSLSSTVFKYTPRAIRKGQYFYIQRSIDDDLRVGLYVAKNDVPANTLITTTDFERVEDGGLNALNDKIKIKDYNFTLGTTAWNGVYYVNVDLSNDLAGGYTCIAAIIESSQGNRPMYCHKSTVSGVVENLRVVSPTDAGTSGYYGVVRVVFMKV